MNLKNIENNNEYPRIAYMEELKKLSDVQKEVMDSFIEELITKEVLTKETLGERLSIIRDGAITIIPNPDDERDILISFEIVRDDLFPYLLVIVDGERFPRTKNCILEMQKTNEVYIKV